MGKLSKVRTAMIESLEKRALFSASVGTLEQDFSAIQQEGAILSVQASTTKSDILADIPAGTKGRGPLDKAILQLSADITAGGTTFGNDLSAIASDQNNAAALAAATQTFTNDVKASRALIKADAQVLVTIETKHPTLLTSNTTISTDISTLDTDFVTTKADYKQLKLDLAAQS